MIKRNIYIILFLWLAGTVRAQQWEARQSMPKARYGACAVVRGLQIWLIGGFDESGTPVNTVDIYNPVSNSWESNGKYLNVPRGNAAAVVHKDTLFVIGGQDSIGQPIASVEKFYPDMRGWEIHSKLTLPRYSLSAVEYDDKIFVIGGATGDIDNMADVEYWDAREHLWKVYEPWKLEYRYSMASVVAYNAVYTFGGIFELGPFNRVERLSINGGVEKLPGMPSPRYNFSAVFVDDTIYLIGGETLGENVVNVASSIAKYNIANNTWSAAENSLNVGRYGLSAVRFSLGDSNFIYIFGGQQYYALDGRALATNQVYRLWISPMAVSVPSENALTSESFRLLQNYPNPFNATTTITFHVAEPASDVTMDIINLQGETIFSQQWNSLTAGEKSMTWAGTDSNGQSVASGVYFYRLSIDNKLFETRKMMLLK